MSNGQFQFTPIQMNTPLDNLTAAISIVQTQILADGTDLIPDVVFGNFHFRGEQMQLAVALLVALLDSVSTSDWEGKIDHVPHP